MVFFARKGQSVPLSHSPSDYLPGEIVTWQLPNGEPHIGIVSDTLADGGRYQMIHNIGAGAQCEDCLFAFKITGHYRYPVSGPLRDNSDGSLRSGSNEMIQTTIPPETSIR